MSNLISKKLDKMRKKSIINDCLKNPNEPIRHFINGSEEIHARPLVEDGELKGFNIFIFDKNQNKSMPFDDPLRDGSRDDNFLSADEYIKFCDKINKERVELYKEIIKDATNEWLDEGSKLEERRQEFAQKIDEKLGTNLEGKKLAKPLKIIEKVVSDKLFGKVNE